MKAKGASPQLFDTLRIIKTDTVYLTKDSIQIQTKLLLDTIKVDNLIEKLIIVKQEGGDIRALKKEIYQELLPDLHYKNTDSLRIVIDGKDHFVRFDMTVVIEDDVLKVSAKPVDNVPFVSVTQEINIDAKKMGRFWKGVQWGSLGTILILVILWFLRGIIGTAIKAYMP